MKCTLNWLREWVDLPSEQTLTEQLTMAGLEVESIDPACPPFHQVVVGQVLDIKKHPQADRLHCCQVDVGSGTLLSIVCGAKNVVAQAKYPVALVGAVLPNARIERVTLRGVFSEGMLCAPEELGLVGPEPGLLTLPDTAPIGVDVRTYLDLDDRVLDLAVTPNRGDCLSIQGIARVVASINRYPLKNTHVPSLVPTMMEQPEARVLIPDICPVYLLRSLRGIDSSRTIPIAMQEKLRRCGYHLIHPVVDILHYVMLALGQPMHAFDSASITGPMHVRMAKKGETMQALNGQTLSLNPQIPVVADTHQVMAIAGVIGSQGTAVHAKTQDIILEAAYIHPKPMGLAARALHIHTESVYRFERGVDPQLPQVAMAWATELICTLLGGDAGPVLAVQHEPPKRPQVVLREQRVEQILGVALSKAEIEAQLNTCVVTDHPMGWSVTPPSYRFDLTAEVHLIEAIARGYGYDKIPKNTTLTPVAMTPSPSNEFSMEMERIAQWMAQLSCTEAINYSFIDPEQHGWLFPSVAPIALKNPIAPQMGVMRFSLWPGLLKTLVYNQNRQTSHVSFFEMGLCFEKKNQAIIQRPMLGVAMTGTHPVHWHQKKVDKDFFDLKGILSVLLDKWHIQKDCHIERHAMPALHPGVAAKILFQGHCLGVMGQLHPKIQNQYGLIKPVYVLELDLSVLKTQPPKICSEIPKFPQVTRDLALVIDKKLAYHDLEKTITEAGGPYMNTVQLFDYYSGAGVDSGAYSLGVSLTFQDALATLSDDTVDQAVAHVLDVIQKRFKVSIRKEKK